MNEKPFNLNQEEEGLDDLFRMAAEAEQPTAPAHAWLKMNSLLDEEERKRRYRFAWWWLPLLLFLAGHKHFVPQEGVIITATNQTQKATEGIPAEKPLNLHQASGDDSFAQLNLQPTIQQPIIQQREFTVAVQEKSASKKRSAGKQIASIGSITKRIAKQPAGNTTEYLLPIELPPGVSTKNLAVAELEEQSLYPAVPKKQPLSIPVTIVIPDPAVPGQTITATQPKLQAAAYRFYLYGGGGTDRGFVPTHDADFKPVYGAGIGVQLKNRWAIQASFTQTRKLYEAPGDAYTPKKGSYYDNPNYVIKEVYADCAILEIPVSVRYTFWQRQQHQLFGMLSVQNSVMQRESYDYYYERFGQPANGYYTYRTKALELLSGIGFSLGYEYRINNRLHLQAAPYFSLPTKGIGEGSVKLRSAGLFAGLRYSFWKKN
jgi:hypothetical protein